MTTMSRRRDRRRQRRRSPAGAGATTAAAIAVLLAITALAAPSRVAAQQRQQQQQQKQQPSSSLGALASIAAAAPQSKQLLAAPLEEATEADVEQLGSDDGADATGEDAAADAAAGGVPNSGSNDTVIGGPVTAAAPTPLPPLFRTMLQHAQAAADASAAGNTTGMATILPLVPMLLPMCPRENVLNTINPLVFPGKAWRYLSAEQQMLHPANLVFMNLAGVPSTSRMMQVAPCLASWGIVRGSITKISKDYRVGLTTMNTVALVMRSDHDVFVVFRATDDDWVADFNCMYAPDDLRRKFGQPLIGGGPAVKLHRGFWDAYSVVDRQLLSQVYKQLWVLRAKNPLVKPNVWLVGHSLAGALAAIAALRMHQDPLFPGEVGGVVTYGMPRVGNEGWQQLYNRELQQVTLRFMNHRDAFATLPRTGQFCLSTGLKTVFSFRHVGRAALLCPSPSGSGMEEFKVFPKGTEDACPSDEGETPSIATHLIGHYFDGFRRAYASRFGLPLGRMLSAGPHVRSVMCAACAVAVKPYPLPDNKAARNDGVVTCVNDRSCSDRGVFSLVSWAGLAFTSLYRAEAVCDATTKLCQLPSAALTAVANTIADLAPAAINATVQSAVPVVLDVTAKAVDMTARAVETVGPLVMRAMPQSLANMTAMAMPVVNDLTGAMPELLNLTARAVDAYGPAVLNRTARALPAGFSEVTQRVVPLVLDATKSAVAQAMMASGSGGEDDGRDQQQQQQQQQLLLQPHSVAAPPVAGVAGASGGAAGKPAAGLSAAGVAATKPASGAPGSGKAGSSSGDGGKRAAAGAAALAKPAAKAQRRLRLR